MFESVEYNCTIVKLILGVFDDFTTSFVRLFIDYVINQYLLFF